MAATVKKVIILTWVSTNDIRYNYKSNNILVGKILQTPTRLHLNRSDQGLHYFPTIFIFWTEFVTPNGSSFRRITLQENLNGSNTCWLVTSAISNLSHEFLRKNDIVAYILVFGIISGDFLFYIDKVCCAYSLESPRWVDSNESTQHTFMWETQRVKKISLL